MYRRVIVLLKLEQCLTDSNESAYWNGSSDIIYLLRRQDNNYLVTLTP